MVSRALVLGGGGPLMSAWTAGLLAGFHRRGADVGKADYIVGTSAGALIGAQLAGGLAMEDVAQAIIAETGPPRGLAPPSPDAIARLPELFRSAQGGSGDPKAARAEIGRYALAAPTDDEETVVAVYREMLPQAWPERDFACTVVDAGDGGFDLITGGHGMELARAVAASCAVPGLVPPITLNGRRYMDGGLRSSTNADMAAGFDLVLVVAFAAPGERGARMAARLAEEVESLQDGGTIVVAVTPDEAALEAIGAQPMDARRRPAAASAGLAQGVTQAPVLAEVWG